MPDSLIVAQDLIVGYSPLFPILGEVNLTIQKGSITTIVGPNGSGKSTLLKTLARQIKPIAGSVKFQSQDIWQLSQHQFSQSCSYVAQFVDPGSSLRLTVEELVQLGRNPHQKWWSWNNSEKDKQAIEEALQRASVANLRNRYVATLSGGERQRAFIASALAQEAEIILLDEPISNLDFKHQLSVVSLLKELKSLNITIVVILHDLNVINQISDQIIMVKELDGAMNKIAHQGEPAAVLTKPIIKEIFDVDVELIKSSEQGKVFFELYCRA